MTAVDGPDNGQDEGRRVLRMHAAAGSAWTADNLDAPLASGRAGAGEQQRELAARWLADHYGEPPVRAMDPWRADAAALLDLLSLLGGPQPDGEVRQHRMNPDCWCGPVQADNGAWDHQ